MKVSIEELFEDCNRNGISVANIPENVVCALNDAALKGETVCEVSDNTFDLIEDARCKQALRDKTYNDVSVLRLAGMKAESDNDVDDAIVHYAEAIELGEASEFELLHAYRHAYDRIIILLSRTHAYTREAQYIEQLLKHNLQQEDRDRLTTRLEKTIAKIKKLQK